MSKGTNRHAIRVDDKLWAFCVAVCKWKGTNLTAVLVSRMEQIRDAALVELQKELDRLDYDDEVWTEVDLQLRAELAGIIDLLTQGAQE
jgi:hypothetical protein